MFRKFDRVSISTTTRNELHWLPVDQRIVHKLCLLAYKCQHKQAPSYLSSLCAPLSAATTRRHLRAATQGDLDILRTRTVTWFTCLRSFRSHELECTTAIPKVTVAEISTVLVVCWRQPSWRSRRNSLLQDLRVDKYCTLTSTLMNARVTDQQFSSRWKSETDMSE